MESERKIERGPHNLEGEASTDHPIGKGWVNVNLDELL